MRLFLISLLVLIRLTYNWAPFTNSVYAQICALTICTHVLSKNAIFIKIFSFSAQSRPLGVAQDVFLGGISHFLNYIISDHSALK